jgi:gliding motility-associated-like protein
VYLLHVDADGELLGQRVLGSDSPLGTEGLVQQAGTVALFGTFTCGLTGLQAQYGDGVFLAVGDPDLFVARYTFPALSPLDAQQFGGRGGKQAGRIAALPGGALVFTGSYTDDLVVPSDGGAWGEAPFSSGTAGFCGDPNYDHYTQNTSSGLSDGFVARAYVTGRQPYDIWERSGACQRPMLDLCVRSQGGPLCPLQIDTCLAFLLGLHTPFNWTDPFLPPQPGQGPMMDILWSDGSNAPYASALATGWYACTMTAVNGCWSVTDSVYVNISTPPDATISDGLYVNWAADFPQPLTPCDTTVWLWCPTVQPGDQVQWTLPGGAVVANDSVLATVSGAYLVTVNAPNGCIDEVAVLVTMSQSDPLPNVTGVDITLYDPLGGILDGDTVAGCSFGGVLGPADIQFYIDSLPGVIPNNVFVAVNSSGLPGGTITSPNGPFYWSVSAFQGTGWYPIDFTINIFDMPCPSDTLTFMMQDSIYWVQVDEPVALFPDTVLLCPGDTSVLAVQCAGCDLVLWQGPGIVATSPVGDTAWVNAYGYYQLTLQASVPWGGCAFNNYIAVVPPVTPAVFTLPPDGLICPGDTALLVTTTPGVLYAWEGPDGPLNVNNDTVAVTELGDYYLQVTDVGGCLLGAGPLTIAGIGTPFVSTVGDNVLCPGDSVTVEVVGGSGTTVQWQAPLQGSAPVQVIDAPGLYTCWVTSCGITSLLSFPIGLSQPDAVITAPQPAVTCDGAPVLLQGPPGMSAYEWLPGGASTPDLALTQQGYQFVGTASIAQPLTVQGDTVCAGGTALLFANGSGAITWYADAAAQQAIGSGGSLGTGPLAGDSVLFVQQVDGPCIGSVIPVPVGVIEPPGAPVIEGDDALCIGASGLLVAYVPGPATYQWTTPAGPFTGDTLFLNAPVQPGTYTCAASVEGCAGDATAITVVTEDCGLVIPNVFSPNGDGVNDAFTVEDAAGRSWKLEVFDRWGDRVHLVEGAPVRWNGRHDGSGTLVSEGVYFYVLEPADASGATHTGTVQVVR